MPKNRKEHVKRQRLYGMRQKRIRKAQERHKSDLMLLQRVLDHSDRLEAQNPQLFAAVKDVTRSLAEEAGITVEMLMRDGLEVVSDDGFKQTKTPQQIINEIMECHAAMKRAQ
jgi:hypothetical protein